MSQKFFYTVFEALLEVAEDCQFHESQFQTVTHNARAWTRWDIANTNLTKKLKDVNIETAIIKRGCWEMVIMLSPADNCIYTLMRKKRFENIISKPEKNAPQYVRALATLNFELGLANLELFEIQTDKSKLYFVLDNLCKSFSSNSLEQKPNYKIITFDTDDNFRITGFELNVLDYTCHKLTTENILDFGKPVYSNEIPQVDDNTEQMPKLKLKKKAEDRIAGRTVVELKDIEQLHSKNA